VTDARIKQVKGPLGMVHRGFSEGLGYVWKRTLEVAIDCQTAGQSLWFTGHSLGGALAMLAASECVKIDKPVCGLYTFGQPRVGDTQFVEKFDRVMKERTFRYVNDQDIVPRIPPRRVPTSHGELEYSHAGRLRYFDHDGTLQTDERYWDRFLDTLKGAADLFDELLPPALADHSMDKYLANLKKSVAGAIEESRKQSFINELFGRLKGTKLGMHLDELPLPMNLDR